MTDRKYMDIKEFQEFGWLQEINRLVLHPAGLALVVDSFPEGDDTQWYVRGVWDERDDPEGWFFDPSEIDPAKVYRVQRAWADKVHVRKETDIPTEIGVTSIAVQVPPDVL